MIGLKPPTMHIGRPVVPRLLKAPAAPKIAAIKLKPLKMSTGGTGVQATHMMTNGSTKKFMFADPMKAGSHLKRISRSQWREPGRNEANAVLHSIDEVPG